MVVHIEPSAVEINAPPAKVREVVLDFAKYSEWHNGHFEYIKVAKPLDKNPADLVKGDKLEVKLKMGMKFSPEIKENSPEKLRWLGSAPFIFSGDHSFEFRPSETNPGGTRFVQYEDFSGMLAHTMETKRKSGQKNIDGFIAFNEDVKKRCESLTGVVTVEDK